MARVLFSKTPQPILLVDWTEVGKGRFYSLVAAVPVAGRSIPIYLEVHSQKNHGTRKVEHAFLDTLYESIVPKNCRPIIVADAGFKNPWFRKVSSLNWDYIGRVNAHVLLSPTETSQQQWTKAEELFRNAKKGRVTDLGTLVVAKSNPLSSRLVLTSAPKKRKNIKSLPQKTRSKTIEYHRLRATAPWLLQSSLNNVRAQDIVRWYATRMRIEETFRDMKSHRFGMSLEDARTHRGKYNRQLERYRMLLLLASLGLLTLSLIGILAEKRGWARAFQANTTRDKRVLSLVFLGRRFLQRTVEIQLRQFEILDAWIHLKFMIESIAERQAED
jgi:hypothetical protein